MPSKRDLPAITGPQLGKLLLKDGWSSGRRKKHGQHFEKRVARRLLTTTIPLKRKPIPQKTLGAILGPQQTCLGKAGLRALIDKYGLS